MDFSRRINSFGFIVKILKVPFYSSFLGFVVFRNGLCSYLLLSDNLSIGSRIFCGTSPDINKLPEALVSGASVPLLYANLFSPVNILSYRPIMVVFYLVLLVQVL